MKQYNIDEFISSNNKTTDTIEDVIDKKIALLYDFCILRRTKYGKCDSREQLLHDVLAKYTTEFKITSVLHDVLMGRTTLDEFLNKEAGIKKCVKRRTQPNAYLVRI